jgi:pimeloyl-ACP methyl ester carboxylesterase
MPWIAVGSEQIYYVERGHGFSIVFIHGAGSSHLIWGAQLRALGDTSRAIALDLPGHGRSLGAGRESIDAYCDHVVAFLDALAIGRAILVGHSMGGAIALELALSHPDRVAALGLIGTGARLRVLPEILDGVSDDFENTVRMVTEYSFADDASRALKSNQKCTCALAGPHVLRGDYVACNAFDALRALTYAPTLVICGREDRMTLPKYSEFWQTVSRARAEWVDRSGHRHARATGCSEPSLIDHNMNF